MANGGPSITGSTRFLERSGSQRHPATIGPWHMDPAKSTSDPGYRYMPRVFNQAELVGVKPMLAAIPSSAAGKRWAGPALASLLCAPAMQPIMEKLAELLPDMAVIRAVAFRKDADAN